MLYRQTILSCCHEYMICRVVDQLPPSCSVCPSAASLGWKKKQTLFGLCASFAVGCHTILDSSKKFHSVVKTTLNGLEKGFNLKMTDWGFFFNSPRTDWSRLCLYGLSLSASQVCFVYTRVFSWDTI